ncbi:hypothetical protein F2Q70_00004156 [Brassica cretica]|uniref:Uncharacterized protein n=1 Tax=Brassica cretica TaxID=69181 RepID=A0A8S9IK65_BRACR|nr:hypothetical protein F2Q70_00004156 [Brassica cretica]
MNPEVMWESKVSPLDPEIVSGPECLVGTRRFSFRSSDRIWTRRSCGNPETWRSPLEPGDRLGTQRFLQTLRSYFGPRGRIRTWRSFGNPEVPSDPEVVFKTRRSFGNPEVPSDPEVVFRTRRSFGNSEVPSDPEVVFRTRRSYLGPEEVVSNPEVALDPEVILNPEVALDLEVLRSFQDPETAWGPEGTVLRLPRQDYSRYLFGFSILSLGSRPLSSSYVVFYFCRKSLTGLEGAGVGFMTQMPGLRCFPRLEKQDLDCSMHLTGPRYALSCTGVLGMDAGVGAEASLNRNLEAGVLPEAWMIFPNQFAPYFSISSSNSGNNLCTQVNRSCSFSAGFPWAGHRSSNPSFPGSS